MKHENEGRFQDPISEFLSKIFGSPFFVYGSLLLALLWIGGNIVAEKMGYDPIDHTDTFFVLMLSMGFFQVFAPSFLLIAETAKEKRAKMWEDRMMKTAVHIESLLEKQEDILEKGAKDRAANAEALRLNQVRIMASESNMRESMDAILAILLEMAVDWEIVTKQTKGEQDEATRDAGGRRYSERLARMAEDGRSGEISAGGSFEMDGGSDPAH